MENEFIEKKSEDNNAELKSLTKDYSAIDSFFRQEYESNFSYSEIIRSIDSEQNILLISPVSSGIVSSNYDPINGHFGIDYVPKGHSVVLFEVHCDSDSDIWLNPHNYEFRKGSEELSKWENLFTQTFL